MIEPPLPRLIGEKPQPKLLQILSIIILLASLCLFYFAYEVRSLQDPLLFVAFGALVIIGGFLQIAWGRENDRWRKYQKKNMIPSLPEKANGG